MAAVTQVAFNLTGGGEPQKVEGRRVTAGFFPLLGVAPQLGRVFEPEEDQPGANRVAVLSHGLWQRRFGRDPGVVGRDILLNGEKYTRDRRHAEELPVHGELRRPLGAGGVHGRGAARTTAPTT